MTSTATTLLSITSDSPKSDELDPLIHPLSWPDRGDLLTAIYFITRNYRPGIRCFYQSRGEQQEKISMILRRFFPQVTWINNDNLLSADLYIINQQGDYNSYLEDALPKYGAESKYDMGTARAIKEAKEEYSTQVKVFLADWGQVIKEKLALIDFDLEHEEEQVKYLAGQLLAVPYSSTRFKLMVRADKGYWDPAEYRSWLYGHHNSTTISTGWSHPVTGLPEPVDWPRLTQRWDTAAESHILAEYLQRVKSNVSIAQLSAGITKQLGGGKEKLAELQELSSYTPFL